MRGHAVDQHILGEGILALDGPLLRERWDIQDGAVSPAANEQGARWRIGVQPQAQSGRISACGCGSNWLRSALSAGRKLRTESQPLAVNTSTNAAAFVSFSGSPVLAISPSGR